MSSRSTTSRNRLALVAFAAVVLAWGSAYAGGRKRIVVLEFEGPKAEQFHDDLVKLIKRQHTVVPTDKWNGVATDLDAANVTEKNVKKVAKRLKIDGVVQGRIEKRRDEYIVHLKLRAGTSGELVGNPVDTTAEGPRLSGQAQRDVKDELIGSIADLTANHGGGGGDDDDADADPRPAKKKAAAKKDDDSDDDPAPASKKKSAAKKDDDSDDDPAPAPKKKGAAKKDVAKKDDAKKDDDGDDDPPPKKGFSKHAEKGGDKVGKASANDDDDTPLPKSTKKASVKKDDKKDDDDTSAALVTKKDDDGAASKSKKATVVAKADDDPAGDADPPKKKKVARRDDDDSGGSASAEADVETPAPTDGSQFSPANRAIDVTLGASFTSRNLNFSTASSVSPLQAPPSYNQNIPVAGVELDVTGYPLAYGHTRHDLLSNLGLEILYDKVLHINSQELYGMPGMQNVANLSTSEERLGLFAVFRYPVMPALLVGGKLGYVSQRFDIEQTLPDGTATNVPNVAYAIVPLTAWARYTIMPKLTAGADLSFLAVTAGGSGTADVGGVNYYKINGMSGFEVAATAEYDITARLFARAVVRYESIGMSFGNNAKSDVGNTTNMQTVSGASDGYFGFGVLGGFLF